MVSDLKDGGKFLLNAPWTTVEELDKNLPASVKVALAKKNAELYVIDAISIASKLGLGGRTNTILQSAFFLINESVMAYDKAIELMKKMAYKSFAKKGDAIVKMNYDAIDSAKENLVKIEIPSAWANATDGAPMAEVADNEYFKNIVHPILALQGDKLPSSAFNADGSVPTGTTQFEKRGVAVKIPLWDASKCIQCNQCAFVCPHACIRPALVAKDATRPDSFVTKACNSPKMKEYEYRMQVSPLDCMGCGVCADICPAKEKALTMVPLSSIVDAEKENYAFSEALPEVDTSVAFSKKTVIGSQYSKPLFEFSGACAGCGETPYLKVVTQLFGDRMIVANATGCSSIYGGSAPTCPYTTNKQGHGPAWANSLFEDNAEFGYGMNLAYGQRRAFLTEKIQKVSSLLENAKCEECANIKVACDEWLANKKDAEMSKLYSAKLVGALSCYKGCADQECTTLIAEILQDKDCLVKKSIWIFGGDGWAYDIGYGGLDHVIAMGEDVNILVLDTEVYSNTGGQSSKSTPTGSVAKFAAAGKRVKKKDLGMMAISYGYVYVAQCSMGANKQQFLNALTEAESYDGPSLIICYAPCINHGINMSKSQDEQKKAVDCGYWQLYRYNPALEEQGKNPFTLDSKEPTGDYKSFLLGETRYASLMKARPETAEALFEKTHKDSMDRIAAYKHLADKQ